MTKSIATAKHQNASIAKVITNPRSSAVLSSRFIFEFDRLLLAFAKHVGLKHYDKSLNKI